jgi:uncharacterized membrane protein
MLYEMLYVFMIFIIYSFFGWLIEMFFVYLNDKKFVNRGFLLGPYCPIYGFGAFILIYVMTHYEKSPLDLFMTYAIYASLLEYITSFLMEKLFNARWWDYSHMKFNVNGRICLSNAILFGLLGMIMGYFVNPLILHLLNIIPYHLFITVSMTIAIIFMIDLFISFNIVTKLRKNLDSLNKDMTEEINKQVEKYINKNHIIKSFPQLKQKINVFQKKA